VHREEVYERIHTDRTTSISKQEPSAP